MDALSFAFFRKQIQSGYYVNNCDKAFAQQSARGTTMGDHRLFSLCILGRSTGFCNQINFSIN